MKNQPLSRRFSRLTHFADFFFRYGEKGITITAFAVFGLVVFVFFGLTTYSLLAKFTATLVVYSFILFFLLIPFYAILAFILAITKADD